MNTMKYDEMYVYTTCNEVLEDAVAAALSELKTYERVDVPLDVPRVALPVMSTGGYVCALENYKWDHKSIYYGRILHEDDVEMKHVTVAFAANTEDIPRFHNDSPEMRDFVLSHPDVVKAIEGWSVDVMDVHIATTAYKNNVHRTEVNMEKRYFMVVDSSIDLHRPFKTSEEAEAAAIKFLETTRNTREFTVGIIAVDTPVDGSFETAITNNPISSRVTFNANLMRAKDSNPRVNGHVIGIPFNYNGSFGEARVNTHGE